MKTTRFLTVTAVLLSTTAALAPATFAARLHDLGEGVLVGPGAPLVLAHAAPGGPKWLLAPPHLLVPRPAAVGALGLEALRRGESVLPERLTALYLRPPAARAMTASGERR